LAYPNGLLDLHIETFGRTPWLGDQPDTTFGNVANLKYEYLGTIVPSQNYIHKEIRSRLKIKIYKGINLALILYGCETWPLMLRKEHRLRVSENMGLGGMFRPRRNDMAEGWRRLHNEELHNLFISTNIL
jgi:hypothetical protein